MVSYFSLHFILIKLKGSDMVMKGIMKILSHRLPSILALLATSSCLANNSVEGLLQATHHHRAREVMTEDSENGASAVSLGR